MESCYLNELLPYVSITGKNVLVKGVSIDSRTTVKDDIYFAIKGSRYDGHDFIEDAVSKGACAVIYSKDMHFDEQSFSGLNKVAMIKMKDSVVALGEVARVYIEKFKNTKKVAITGSNGKTTTKEMLSSILKTKEKTLSNKGNFNNRIGLPLSVFNLDSYVNYGVFEIGTSFLGEIKILSNIIKPDIGVIANIGFSHLEEFKSPEGVLREKIDLFYNVKENGVLVVNNDDENLKHISDKNFKNKTIIRYSLRTASSDVYASNIKMSQNGTSFSLCYNDESIDIFIPAKGVFNVSNALAAASCAISLNVPFTNIKMGLESFVCPKMRMDTITTSNGIILINDSYNANPSSTKASIETILELYTDKKINLVLGDMLELGENSDKFHFELGKFIDNKNVNSISLLGNKSLNVASAINSKNVFYAKDKESLLLHLEKLTENDSVFLFKASRGMGLEEVCEKFRDILQ